MLLTLVSVCPVWADEFDPGEIYRKTSPAVVLITGANSGDRSKSVGTGSIIREDGLVITNAHVVLNPKSNKPFQNIRVYLKPKRLIGDLEKDTALRYKAKLVGYSQTLDLAVLKIIKLNLKVASLPFANSDNTVTGEKVVAIGHPEQGGLWTLTTGTISSHKLNFQNIPGKHVFQTETSINKGNSGGPLINRKGQIIGVNSNLARKGKGGITITGINFAIKSNVATKWLSSIGYLSGSMVAKSTESKAQPKVENAGIVPIEKMKSDSVKPLFTEDPPPEPRVLTKPRPYKKEHLFQHVEDEMEIMMENMKTGIRSKK
ncbi:MAG TPA: serine protease [Nitrospinaceae bacterium]|nr:serine protease [Nitrospinaceae bacterium]